MGATPAGSSETISPCAIRRLSLSSFVPADPAAEPSTAAPHPCSLSLRRSTRPHRRSSWLNRRTSHTAATPRATGPRRSNAQRPLVAWSACRWAWLGSSCPPPIGCSNRVRASAAISIQGSKDHPLGDRGQLRPSRDDSSQIGGRICRRFQPFATVFRRVGCNHLCNHVRKAPVLPRLSPDF